jgi:hypothetical protein
VVGVVGRLPCLHTAKQLQEVQLRHSSGSLS